MAILFDGVDDLVNCGSGSSLDNLSAMTASFWIKKSTSVSGRTILSKYTGGIGGWDIVCDDNNTNIFFEQTFDTDSVYLSRNGTSVFVSNTWTHVVVTYDGGTLGSGVHIYKNGTEVSYNFTANGGSSKDSDATSNFKISDIYSAYFDGTLQEVAVWNTVLSGANITALYNSGVIKKNLPNTISTSSLKGYWPLDDGQDGTSADGATVRDASGNGNNGTGDNGVNNTGLTWKDTTYQGSIQSISFNQPNIVESVKVTPNAQNITALLTTPNRLNTKLISALQSAFTLQTSSVLSSLNKTVAVSVLNALFNQPSVTLSGSTTTTVIVSALTSTFSVQSVSLIKTSVVSVSSLIVNTSITSGVQKGTITPNALSETMALLTPLEEARVNTNSQSITSNLTNRTNLLSILPSNLSITSALTTSFFTTSGSKTVIVNSLSALLTLQTSSIAEVVRQVLIFAKHNSSINTTKVKRTIRYSRDVQTKNIVKSEHYHNTAKSDL